MPGATGEDHTALEDIIEIDPITTAGSGWHAVKVVMIDHERVHNGWGNTFDMESL
jgi:hypothetical protein